MRNFFQKIGALSLSFLLFFSSCFLHAQEANNYFPSQFYSTPPSVATPIANLQRYLEQQTKSPFREGLGILRTDFEESGFVNACTYARVIADDAYLEELSGEDLAEIVYYGHFVYVSGSEKKCEQDIKNRIYGLLNSTYDDNGRFFQRNGFLLLVASALGRNQFFKWEIEEMAFEKISLAASNPVTSQRARWAVELVYLLAQDPAEAEVPVRSEASREMFERRLERYIRQFDRLKNYRSDYYVPGVPCNDVLKISNQGSLISLFAQVNNYLSMKHDDNILKQMVSTGGLNFIGRGDRPAFSDKGETFYLHHVTPGTDGRGNVTDSTNGHAHLVLHTLITALFISYSSRASSDESSVLMEEFIDSYLDTDAKGHFASYLYIPLQGMRIAKILGDSYSLFGWDREEAALQNKIHSILKKGYTGTLACNYVQGTCEVVVEWLAVGKLMGWIFRGGKAIVKEAGKGIVRVLPAKTVFQLGVAQAITKHAFKWGKQNIKAFLSRYGWKIAVAGGSAALLTGDEPLRQTVNY
ncbi:MAG: hypothetical protein IJ311_04330 [Elusimicrobiaceae bacterium]|nr:hypothetical protein [Elusimicrobiaceae bacterium]